jgi:hypothetical protein
MSLAAKFAIVLLAALVLTVLPGGGATVQVLLTLVTIAFFVSIAFFGARLYREHRLTLDTLEPRSRSVLYVSVGLALLTFAATARLFEVGGLGVLLWIALLAAGSYGVYWVFMQSRSY